MFNRVVLSYILDVYVFSSMWITSVVASHVDRVVGLGIFSVSRHLQRVSNTFSWSECSQFVFLFLLEK